MIDAQREVDVARHALDLADAAGTLLHGAGARADARRDLTGELDDVVRGALRLFGELAHFVGDDGKAARPASPARAASIAALSASKFV